MHYFIDFVYGGPKLLVTFESADTKIPRANGLRDPWGLRLIGRLGCSLIAIKPKQRCWYRRADLHEFLRRPEFRAFCEQFETRLFYGSSMGGYGALSMSAAVPGSIVLAYSPQTSLNKEIAQWDTRYSGRREDWTGDLSDGADAVALAKKVYVAFDPFFPLDVRHIKRLQGSNIEHLKAPFCGHHTMTVAAGLKLAVPVLRQAFEEHSGFFPRLIRRRREHPSYMANLRKAVAARERRYANLPQDVGPGV